MYILEVDVKYPKRLYDFHNDLPFTLWHKYWKSMQNIAARISKYKMINFDDVTNENKTYIIQNGHIFQIIHTEC